LSFNLVLDEPVQGDKVEVHDGLQFAVENKLLEKYGPFVLDSFKRDQQVYLHLRASQKSADDGGGCSTCTSCG